MKRLLTLIVSFTLMFNSAVYADQELVVVDEFQGLAVNPSADKIPNGAHTIFDNMYIKDGNLQIVKGRDRLNASAHSDTVVNGSAYYENAAGTTKKIVIAESDEVVTYDIDGTNRTQIASGLTNEPKDFTKIGDTLYWTSATDGLYKWLGSSTASAVGSVSAPSSVDFSATTGDGGLTTGEDAVAVTTGSSQSDNTVWSLASGSCAAADPVSGMTASSFAKSNVASATIGATTEFDAIPATTVTYKYKVTKFSKAWGIESEASAVDSATLTGNDNVSTFLTNSFNYWNNSGCSSDQDRFRNIDFIYTGKQTRTTGTLASAPAAPFDGYRVYRSVAGGDDLFFLGYQTTGAYNDGKPDTVLGDPLDVTIDTIAPPSYKYIESYKGALVMAEGNSIVFSRLPVESVADADTYWLDSDEILLSSDEVITGLITTSNSLLVFTSSNVYELTGYGITSLRLTTLLKGIGAVNDNAIEVDDNGDVLFFAGTDGLYKLRTFQQAQDSLTGTAIDNERVSLVKVSSPFMDDVFKGVSSQITLTVTDFSSAHAYYDKENDLYFLYIGKDGFIFDSINKSWTHLPGTQFINSLYRKSPNGSGQGIITDNLGFFYNNWTGYETGIHSGTVTGVPTSVTGNTLTDSTATFNTTSDGLKGLWVFVDNELGEWRQITSNTGTALTIGVNWSVNPTLTDTYYIGHVIPEWQTKEFSMVKAPDLFRMENFYLIHEQPSSSVEVDLYAFHNKEDSATSAFSQFDLYSTKTTSSTDKFIKKFGIILRSNWFKFKFKSFIYNTSNSIRPPINISAYALEGDIERRE